MTLWCPCKPKGSSGVVRTLYGGSRTRGYLFGLLVRTQNFTAGETNPNPKNLNDLSNLVREGFALIILPAFKILMKYIKYKIKKTKPKAKFKRKSKKSLSQPRPTAPTPNPIFFLLVKNSNIN